MVIEKLLRLAKKNEQMGNTENRQLLPTPVQKINVTDIHKIVFNWIRLMKAFTCIVD